MDEEEEQRRVLEQVFGSDSESDWDLLDPSSTTVLEVVQGRPRWEKVDGVDGLWLCREFLDPYHQSWLLSSMDREGWFPDANHNQAMRFGDLPEWVCILSSLVRESCLHDAMEWGGTCDQDNENICPLSMDILCREPLFDQLIANSYEPGEGICPHVDLMRFEDGIAIVSLRSPCVMHFTPTEQQRLKTSLTRVPVLLKPGSLVVMSGEARYIWRHEINRKPGFQFWEGKEIVQQRRTSITLRKLCPQA